MYKILERKFLLLRLRMYESGNEIIDTIVKTKDMQGGRLGKVSNKMIVISISWFATYNIV